MLSFHNDPAIKEKYLSRVIKHRELDNIVQRIGWKNGKGCAIGCTLESYDHYRYPIELGLPVWLAHLQDKIHENFSKEKAMLWPEKFLFHIPVGVDVENVKHKTAIRRLNRIIELQEKNGLINEELKNTVIKSIKNVILFHEKCLESGSSAEAEARSAARLAEAAALSALSEESEAWLAGEAILAEAARSAAEAAGSAALSARVAAMSEEAEARSAARLAGAAAGSAEAAAMSSGKIATWPTYFEKEAEDLLELLSQCK